MIVVVKMITTMTPTASLMIMMTMLTTIMIKAVQIMMRMITVSMAMSTQSGVNGLRDNNSESIQFISSNPARVGLHRFSK